MKIWIGTHPDPEQRVQIEVSEEEYDKLPPRGLRGQAALVDLVGNVHVLRRASCGLPRCLCALEFVRTQEKGS